MENKIKDRVIKSEKINWRKCKWFQPDNLKAVTDEDFDNLKEIIKERGIIRSFKVWEYEDKIYILDGHLLQKVLLSLDNVPDLLSAEFIECDNKKQAAENVLYYSSFWHRIANEGLFKFTEKFEINIPKLKINLPLINYNQNNIDHKNIINEVWQDLPEFENEDITGRMIKVHFDNDEDVNRFAKLIDQKITEKTRAIWFPKRDLDSNNRDKIYIIESKNEEN